MNNVERLDAILDRVIESLAQLSGAAAELKAALKDGGKTPQADSVSENKPKKYTFQEVRGIMATLSGKGKKAEAKDLLAKYGAGRLSEVEESDYPALVSDAEVALNE